MKKTILLIPFLLFWGTYWGQAQTKPIKSKADLTGNFSYNGLHIMDGKNYTGITIGSQFAFTQDVGYADSVQKYDEISNYYREYGTLDQYQRSVVIYQFYNKLVDSSKRVKQAKAIKLALNKKYRLDLDSLIKVSTPSHRP